MLKSKVYVCVSVDVCELERGYIGVDVELCILNVL